MISLAALLDDAEALALWQGISTLEIIFEALEDYVKARPALLRKAREIRELKERAAKPITAKARHATPRSRALADTGRASKIKRASGVRKSERTGTNTHDDSKSGGRS